MAFDAREATIASTHRALYSGQTTCRAIVSSFISRIEALNVQINAIIALAPDALEVADILDHDLATGSVSPGPLFGIPVLLKDNFDTGNMPTTGGSLALADHDPAADAPVVEALKDAGAIILGKANLHEMALEGLTVSSLGGQTINPYDSTRTAGGSSGGTGAAIAASFAVLGTGSDTVNSLRSPASANGLVSCRPTRGLISRAGVMPVSETQDAVGPIARCVEDAAIALTVMASIGADPNDGSTASVPKSARQLDYSVDLAHGSLKGLRLGLFKTFHGQAGGDETTPVNNAMAAMVESLTAAGATIVPIDEQIYDSVAIFKKLDVQRYEFRELIETYLKRPDTKGSFPKSLKELLESGKSLIIPLHYNHIKAVLTSSTEDAEYREAKAGIEELTQALQETFSSNQFDAIIYPEQKNLVVKIGSPTQIGRNGILAGVTGFPVVALPCGYSPATPEAPRGVPIGVEILGQPWSEAQLLQIAYQVERLSPQRLTPAWAQREVSVQDYNRVPTIVPDNKRIDAAYPVGVYK